MTYLVAHRSAVPPPVRGERYAKMTETMTWGLSLADIHNRGLYERAQQDADFLRRVRDAYTGAWDVVDALWWELYPAEPGPSGAPSPMAELRDLQRRLFSLDGDARGDQSTTELMRELKAEIATERSALSGALARAAAGQGTRPYQSDAEVSRFFEQLDSSDPQTVLHASTVEPAAGADVPGRARKLAVTFGVVGALIVGVFAGTQLGGGTADAAPPIQSALPRASAEPGPLALAVFDRPQAPEDIPGAYMPETMDPSSFRALGGGLLHDSPHGAVFAAKTTSGLVCMVAVASAEDYVSTCIFARDFPITGIRLYWPVEMASMREEGGETTRVPMDIYTVWKTDGTLEGGGAGRQVTISDPGTMS